MIPVPDFEYEIKKLEKEIAELEKKKTTKKPPDFESDIFSATIKGKLSSVQYLVEIEKISVETKDISGRTSLFYASANGFFRHC